MAEVVLGLSRKLAFSPEYPLRWVHDSRATVNVSAGGELFVSARSETPQRVLELPFPYMSSRRVEEARDLVYLRSLFGVGPVVVVPLDTEPAVLHGRVDASWESEQAQLQVFPASIRITEDPHPNVYA